MTNAAAPAYDTTDRAIRAILHVLPASAKLETPRDAADRGIDLFIAGQPFQVKWLGEGSLGRVRSLLARSADLGRPPAIVVARRLSPGACDALGEAGVGWVDETGAAEIATGSLLVSRTGQPVQEPPAQRWKDSVLAVAEALLCGTTPTVSATTAATGLSTGSCTNALRFLTTEALLQASASRGRHSARTVANRDRLLEAYATSAISKPDGPSLAAGILGRDPIHELAEIGQRWSESDMRWAATGLAAASVVAPLVTSISTVEVYLDATTHPGLNAAAQRAGLRPVDGGRLTLRPFPTVTTDRLAGTIDGLRVAPWPRVFVDLQRAGVRGEQAAEHLRETVSAT